MKEISIRSMRVASGLSQRQLAEKIGVQQESVTQWETGKTTPKFNRLTKIADALNCSVNDLVREENDGE